MEKEDAKLLERVFSHFAKKLRMGKSDGKLLEMLLKDKEISWHAATSP
jgi:hypothetical protein